MNNYDWLVQVRVTGTRNGWSRTLVDTPRFELRSNAQFGGIWADADVVADVAHGMFRGLADPGDEIHVVVAAIDGGSALARTYGAIPPAYGDE